MAQDPLYATEKHLQAAIITLAHGQVWELSVVKRKYLWAKKLLLNSSSV